MRYIYVDEAGTSASEPVTVVAGVIIHPDNQWRAVESKINRLLDEFVPASLRQGFVFHAKEVFGGGKYRDHWPRESRWGLLHQMVSIPKRFKLPVAFGMTARNRLPPEVYQRVAAAFTPAGYDHYMAFRMCVGHADRYLRLYTHPDEVATLVMEDVSHLRKLLRAVPDVMRKHPTRVPPGGVILPGGPSWQNVVEPPEELKVTKIVDCAHYAEKTEAPLLQLADACAFTLRRWVNRQSHGDDLAKSLRDDPPEPTGFADPASKGVW